MASPSPWKLGIFYYDRGDSRLVVPKRIQGLGWTINWGHPRAWVAASVVVLLVLFAVFGSIATAHRATRHGRADTRELAGGPVDGHRPSHRGRTMDMTASTTPSAIFIEGSS